MKLYLFLFRIYFKILGSVSPKTASIVAFKLFQKVRVLPIKPKEAEFYANSRRFAVQDELTEILCYENGPKDGSLIFLVHGWESNAGSLNGIVSALAAIGKRVVSIDLPGHGKHTATHTNLLECKSAFQSVIKHVNPQEPFSVLSHSFGSAVTTFALSEEKRKVDQLIYLTTPNEMTVIFEDFGKLVGLNKKVLKHIIDRASKLLGQDLDTFTVSIKGKEIEYNKLTLIHDRFDKIIPFANSENISKNLTNTELITLEKAGHYRMLWNDEVIEKITTTLQQNEVVDA
ncbi:MAG: pimeloyl-ACP methyl ester carboxylesterase [Flavobacteriales bacterium]|jgi:pimeloyl-ACP methyl ester carboxylesterase